MNKNKLKIIHLCNYFQPALGYQEYFLAREHARFGHDVTVITSDRYFPFPDYENTVKDILGDRFIGSGYSIYDGIKIIRLKVLLEFSARVYLIGLKRVISSISPDVVICHGMSNLTSLRIIPLKKRFNFNLIYDDHVHFSEKNNGLLGKIFYSIFDFNKIYLNADRLIGVSTECVDFISENYKMPRRKIELIPLGADTELFKYDRELRNKFRKKYNVSIDSLIICYTGKLTYKKGPHNILLAIDKIKDKLKKEVILLFVGNFESTYKDFFYNLSDRINKKNIRIINRPAVENRHLAEIYSATDIACWPRQASMSMIEASSCGVPIICADFLKERYRNDNGIPVREDDIDDLAGALLRLIKNATLRKRMGKKGRELIEKELSWRIIAKKFLERI